MAVTLLQKLIKDISNIFMLLGCACALAQSATCARNSDIPAVAADTKLAATAVETQFSDDILNKKMEQANLLLQKRWQSQQAFKSLRCIVLSRWHQDGSITHIKVARTSGLSSNDGYSVKLLKSMGKLQPLPQGYPQYVVFTVDFDCDKFSKTSAHDSAIGGYQPYKTIFPEYSRADCEIASKSAVSRAYKNLSDCQLSALLDVLEDKGELNTSLFKAVQAEYQRRLLKSYRCPKIGPAFAG